MKIIIATTFYLTKDVLAEITERAVRSIKTSLDHEIILINNYCEPQYLARMEALGKVIQNKENSYAIASNMAIKYGIENKADYIIIMNNDIVLRHDAIDNLVKFAEEHPEFAVWAPHPIVTEKEDIENVATKDGFYNGPNWACFMISPKSIERLKQKEEGTKEPFPGLFDETLRRLYFEDTDYYQRLAFAGLKTGVTYSSLFWHYGSATIKLDNEWGRTYPNYYEWNREYFKRKWGFDIHHKYINWEDPIRFTHKGPFEP
jgi:GT2 family glycosyltransferase